MLNALEKVMYPNGTARALGDIVSGSVSSIIDEVHANTSAITSITAQLSALVDDVGTNTSAISAINTKLGDLTYDSETDVYNMASGLNVRWHLNAQHYLRANDFDIGVSNAGFRNSIYRGKNLGTSVTLDQWDAIEAGTFEGLFIGDYWTINNVNWRIAAFDYWLNTGDNNCTIHHVVIVPDTNLYSAQMNTEDVTTGGYYSSEMHGDINYLVSGSSNLYNAKTAIDNAFGSVHILSHRELFTNGVSNGDASGWAWYNSTVDLVSEVMVYGTLAWSVGGKGYEVGSDKEQLALFRLDHSRICNRESWWLRSVYSAAAFAFVDGRGAANNDTASASRGVRPAFAICNPTTQQTATRKKASKKKGE